MKPVWFAVQVAIIFMLVTLIVLAGTLMLFGRVAGHDLLLEMAMLRCHEGVRIAEQVEALLDTHTIDDPEILRLVRDRKRRWHTVSELRSPKEHRLALTRTTDHRHRRPAIEFIEIAGRRCTVIGPPVFESVVPIIRHSEPVAMLVLRGSIHPSRDTYHEFLVGLLEIGAVALIGVIIVSIYLTRPLRRMRRSMDRIADGDLDHRVVARGRSEVAAMGRSFNTMADRINAMINGQKELMAGVSHELRSPLARMKVALELLREGGAGNAQVQEVEDEVDTLDEMVEELLTISRLDMGARQLNLVSCDLDEIASRAWRRVEEQVNARRMELVVDLDDEARFIQADEALMVRALGNLFENAVCYAKSGPVTLRSRRDSSHLRIEVEDEGPGVDERLFERLFEPFFRADPSRSRTTGATGLGLMIVRRAVEAHGGIVAANRGNKGGLVIRLELPL